jgi:general secretion pathway protein H
MQASAARAHPRAGFTFVEILVVLTLILLVSGVALAGSAQLPSARLRRSATLIASAIKVAFTRSTATSRDLRLVMDLESQKIWLEEADVPMLVTSGDKSIAGGADPMTAAEQAAIEEGERIIKGPPIPKPRFHSIEVFGFGDVEGGHGGKTLQRGIRFRAVQTAHDDTVRTSGRAYLYFWRGGRTEQASIQLHIGDSVDDARTLTLLVSPLTGRVRVRGGAVELVVPTDDEHASDRQDTGF